MKNDRFTFPDGRVLTYPKLFEIVQKHISTECPEAAHSLTDLPDVVQRVLINRRVEANRPLTEVAADMAQDMAGVSAVLSRYLDHLEDYPTLEEVNINSWNSIVLKYMDGPDEWLEETFLSPRHAFNILNRMVSKSRTGLLNEATPGAVSYIVDGVRNTALCSPVAPRDTGVYASIRIVRPQSVSGEKLLNQGELSPDMLELLELFVRYGVNAVFSGKPRSGKTALLNYLLSVAAERRDIRIGTVEEGSRELTLRRFGEDGRPTNQVLSFLTRPSGKPEQNFDSEKLLEFSLRYDLDYLIPQEMRSVEAYAAQETARTGMAVYTTIHCARAQAAYDRIVTLCQRRSKEPASVLLRYAVEAFPISVHLKIMRDGRRRCMEIVEAEAIEEGGLKSRVLYRFAVKDNLQTEEEIKVVGRFEQIGPISERLRETLLENGASLAEMNKFI